MAMTSFSKTGQDVMIGFLLAHHRLIPKDKDYIGYYLDIGCCDPIQGSNTYAFYKRGWSGLCVDANPDVADNYRAVRPNDVVVSCGVGAKAETLTFYRFANQQHNTFNPGRADRFPEKLRSKIEVPVRTLTSLIDEFGPADRKIDFMSMDVEGFEMNVLTAIDFEKHRPSLIIIELFVDMKKLLQGKSVLFLEQHGYRLISYSGHDAIFVVEGG